MRVGTKAMVAALALSLSLATAAVAAVPPGTVGGPPRFPVNLPSIFGSKQTSREIVLAGTLSRSLGLEITGFESNQGACIWVSTAPFGGAYGSCGTFAPPSAGAIVISGSGGSASDSGWITELDGELAPEVVRVKVSYRLQGREMQRKATVARVQHRLLGVLGLKRPFGYFAIALNGCVTSPIEAVAYDAHGRELGTARLDGRSRLTPSQCKFRGSIRGFSVEAVQAGSGNLRPRFRAG